MFNYIFVYFFLFFDISVSCSFQIIDLSARHKSSPRTNTACYNTQIWQAVVYKYCSGLLSIVNLSLDSKMSDEKHISDVWFKIDQLHSNFLDTGEKSDNLKGFEY